MSIYEALREVEDDIDGKELSGSNDDVDVNSVGSGGHSGSDADDASKEPDFDDACFPGDPPAPSPANVMTYFRHVTNAKVVTDAMPAFKLTHRWEVTEASNDGGADRVLGSLSMAADALKVRCGLHTRHRCQLWLRHGGSGLGRAECLAVQWLIAGAADEDRPECHKAAARQAAALFKAGD